MPTDPTMPTEPMRPLADDLTGTAGPPPPRRGSVHATVARVMAVVAAFLLVSFLVVTTSRAAFTDTTDNIGNEVSTGTISLTDNDAGTAMFDNVTGLGPNDTIESCIDVTYTGTLTPSAVQLYMSEAPTGELAPYLDLVVQIGAQSGDPFGDCTTFTASNTLYTGTLAGMATTHPSYETGVSTWTPSGSGDARTFRFVLTVQDDPAAQGTSTTFGFTWEVRSS